MNVICKTDIEGHEIIKLLNHIIKKNGDVRSLMSKKTWYNMPLTVKLGEHELRYSSSNVAVVFCWKYLFRIDLDRNEITAEDYSICLNDATTRQKNMIS